MLLKQIMAHLLLSTMLTYLFSPEQHLHTGSAQESEAFLNSSLSPHGAVLK